ncbi:hypothetical protein ACLOJK_020880 [Asimina triloba]
MFGRHLINKTSYLRRDENECGLSIDGRSRARAQSRCPTLFCQRHPGHLALCMNLTLDARFATKPHKSLTSEAEALLSSAMPTAVSKRRRPAKQIVEDSTSEDETEAPEPKAKSPAPASAPIPEPKSRKGKGKKDKAPGTPELSGNSKRRDDKVGKSSSKRLKLNSISKVEEEVCFVCFESGSLVICDDPVCPKAYHPACTKHDEEFFKSMDEWSCSKFSPVLEHTVFMRDGLPALLSVGLLFVGSKMEGAASSVNLSIWAEAQVSVQIFHKQTLPVKSAERIAKAPADHHDENSRNYLFNCYWLDLKGKLSLTSEELNKARNPWKESGSSSHSAKSSDELHDVGGDPGSGYIGASNATGSKTKKRFRVSNEKGKGKESAGFAGTSEPEEIEWASEELMRFVEHMKDGNTSVLSHADVLLLLLKYINKNNLRDPRKRSQVICDPMLVSLFKKERVGHVEMLKLLDPHFLVKDSDATQLESDRSNYAMPKMNSARKRKMPKAIYERKPQTNLGDYAAIDVHNISLIYLRRSLVEDLLDDMETFHDKVVGSFVRTRILGTDPKKDMHQLVQVVGTSRAEETYTTGKRTTDVMLEILNLENTDFVAVDTISDQEFTEGEVLEKAIDLHAVRFSNWLEKELLLLSRIRDRANEKGRRKEYPCIMYQSSQLKLLNSPKEQSCRLAELPEVHADPSMDPDYDTSKGEGNQDDKGLRKGKDLTSPGKGGSAFSDGWKTQTNGGCAALSGLSTGIGVSANDDETDKIWHYKDPSGKNQGPFSMSQFRKWSKGGYFPADLRIWKTSESEEDSVLLTDALDANSTDPLNLDPFQSCSQPKEDDQEGGWGGASSSKNPDKQSKDGAWESNWNTASGPNDGNDGGWGTQSTGWAAAKTEALSSKGGCAGWESNDSHAWSSQPRDDSSKLTPLFSRSVPDSPSEIDMGVTAPDATGNKKISQDAASNHSPVLTPVVRGMDGGVSAEKFQSGSRNEDNLTLSLNQASDVASMFADGWGTMPMKGPNDDLVETPKSSDRDQGSARGDGDMNWGMAALDKTNVGCGLSGHWETTAEGNGKTGWEKGSQDSSVQGVVNTGWEVAKLDSAGKGSAGRELDATREVNADTGWENGTERKTERVWETPTKGETNSDWGGTAQGKKGNMDSGTTVWSTTSTHDDKNTGKGARIEGHTNVDSGTAKWETSVNQDKDAGWPIATPGNENMGLGTTECGASTHDDKNRGRATSGDATTDSGKAKWESPNKGNVDGERGRPAGGNTNAGPVQDDVDAGSGASAWESPRGDANAVTALQGDANKGWGTTPEGNTDSDWNKSSGNSGSWGNSQKAAQGTSTQGNSKGGWGSAAEGNTGRGTTPEANAGSDWHKPNGNSGSWGSSQKAAQGPTQGSSKGVWGSPAEGNTGWGTTPEGNAGSDWNKSNRNSGSWGSSQKAAQGPTQGSSKGGWGSPAEGNTGWGATPVGNAGSDWNKSNGNSGSWGNSQKATSGVSSQGNSGSGWGSATEGNTNAGWGTGGQGGANSGWQIASEGNKGSDWNNSNGNSGGWGSSQKHTGGRFSGQEGPQRSQNGESWRGEERPAWNRQSSGRDGNSPRMPPRGGQRVCKFHESGHCKKGASCNFLHT